MPVTSLPRFAELQLISALFGKHRHFNSTKLCLNDDSWAQEEWLLARLFLCIFFVDSCLYKHVQLLLGFYVTQQYKTVYNQEVKEKGHMFYVFIFSQKKSVV